MLKAYMNNSDLHGNNKDHTHQSPSVNADILGSCYERRTRVRQLIKSQPLRQREGGIYAIYLSLNCPDLMDPPEVSCDDVM